MAWYSCLSIRSGCDYARTSHLPDIRKGEYEGLPEKFKDEKWRPDYGPNEFNENVRRTGATVIGAREFLIAYNVNLDTQNIQIAKKISGIVRASGVVLVNEKGEKVRVPGVLKFVQAMGVYLKEHNITQVSMNLQNYKITPPHVAYCSRKGNYSAKIF